jgi:AAT family amino acid transporter
VLFAYAVTGVVGMAAAETRRPQQTIPRSVAITVVAVAIMYLGSAYLLTAMQPWTTVPETSSPFVSALAAVALPGATTLMNLVLLFAVLSTMNAALYANVRVLYTLAEERQAPSWLSRLNARGIPARATWAIASLLLGAIALAYVLPHQAYSYLVTATGFQAMFIWLMVLATHLYYRPYLRRQRPERLGFRLWGYPFTTLFVIAVVLAGLAGSLGVRSERVGAEVGFGGIAAAALVWITARRALLPHAKGAPQAEE